MCGIAGIASLGTAPDAALVTRMVRALAHRGPDHEAVGVHTASALRVALGYRRLSIVDLSAAGNQPMCDESGDCWLVYNGELYNQAGLRSELEAGGHRYASRSDTETVVHAYEEWGLTAFERFDGMFAAAIHDVRNERLVLVRDRRGIKPLYYTWDGTTLAFASELKALVAAGLTSRRVDATSLWLYLCLGYVPSPHCILPGVRKLEPGTALIVDPEGLRTFRYAARVPPLNATQGEVTERVRQVVEDAVRKQLMSDVPVGVLLSGGLDSTIVAAMAVRHHPDRIHTFSAGYRAASEGQPIEDRYLDDVAVAREVAKQLGTEHHEVEIENTAQLPDRFRSLVCQLDEPMVEPVFVATDRLAAAAREAGVPVILTGDGADEVFGGYDRYFAAQRLQRYQSIPGLAAVLPLVERIQLLGPLARDAGEVRYLLAHPSSVDRYIRFSTIYRPEQALALLDPELRSEVDDLALHTVVRRALNEARPFVEQMARADLDLWVAEHFNPRLDRITMGHAIEARVPFQDDDVVATALSIPSGNRSSRRARKRVLSEAFKDVVPAFVRTRPKRSFQAPGRAWLQGGLGDGFERLSERAETLSGLFDPLQVRAYATSWGRDTPGGVFAVSALLVAATWKDLYLDGGWRSDG